MKTRSIFLVIWFLLVFICSAMQAQTYEQRWETVQKMEQKDLPKSIIKEAQAIYNKAKAERNVPQMMKSYLTMMNWRGQIAPDSVEVDVRGLESWAEKPTTSKRDRAVLYSILGGLVIDKDYLEGHKWLKRSLADSLVLLDCPADQLVPMVKTGETSRLYLDNNLYDLLARRAIRLCGMHRWNHSVSVEEVNSNIKEIYHSLLDLYQKKNRRAAWLLTSVELLRDNQLTNSSGEEKEKLLLQWMNEYADLEVCAEVYISLNELWCTDNQRNKERLDMLRKGIERYPRYSRVNFLKNAEERILSPRLSVSVSMALPQRPITLDVDHCNIEGFTLQWYRVGLPADSPILQNINEKNFSQYSTLVRQEHIELEPTPDYRIRESLKMVDAPDAGIYYWKVIPNGPFEVACGDLLHLTGIQVIARTLPGNQREFRILDKESGHPIKGAQLNVYQSTSDGFSLQETINATDAGIVILPERLGNNMYYQAVTSTDVAMPIRLYKFPKYTFKDDSQKVKRTALFTDRAIYRPGQTICFSGIAYCQQKDSLGISAGINHTVKLLDADRKEVGRQEVQSDDYGTIHGEFVIPKEGKLGTYWIQCENRQISVKVEEYKRPTFDVHFEPIEEEYGVGDSLRMTGVAKTFAGAPVQGAVVKYQVLRQNNANWWRRGAGKLCEEGETVTDTRGCFDVPVHLLLEDGSMESASYLYQVKADVTNLAGETHAAESCLPLGNSSLRVIANWGGDAVCAEQQRELEFKVMNLMGKPVRTDVTWQVFSVLDDGKIEEKSLLTEKVQSWVSFIPETLYALPSGRYQMKATVMDEKGNRCEWKMELDYLSGKDNKLPFNDTLFGFQTADTFGVDQPVVCCIGSSEKDVCLFYDVFAGDKQLESRQIHFSDSLFRFKYHYQPAYGDGIQVSFALMRNGNLFTKTFYVRKPEPDKKLQLKWETFRDKLQPGGLETWSLSVLHPNGKPADAQLMATMYDASLEQFVKHRWNIGLGFSRKLPSISWRNLAQSRWWANVRFPINDFEFKPLSYSVLDLPFGVRYGRNGSPVLYKSYSYLATSEEVAISSDAMLFESSLRKTDGFTVDGVEMEEDLEEVVNRQFRSDFAETAFFYPQLRTNNQGSVSIQFTLPESLTEWKFMGLAHTQEMEYGMISAEAVASKVLMLQPNIPRFVRMGDRVNIAASLINLSDKDVDGVVRLLLLDAETEKVVVSKKQKFIVKTGATEVVNFAFEVGDPYEMLVCRMIAEGDSFSDGEQRYLPVLSNRQRMVESVLLDVNGAGSSTFSLEELFNRHSKTVTHPKMTVEFTGNPIWYAVKALPVLANPETENAMSWVTAYYANSLTDYLAKNYPLVADSLDLKGLDARLSEAVQRLQDLQLADGAWVWYKGMSGSRYMTTYMTMLLARLQEMRGGDFDDKSMGDMYHKAIAYLAKAVSEEVNRMKEAEAKGAKDLLPSELALQYLYIQTLDGTALIDPNTHRYLTDKLEKNAGVLTIYGKALGTLVLHQAGRKQKAREFMQSLMEYSVVSQTMGRYFDTPKAEYSWFSYKIPTQVAVIETVKAITQEKQVLEELKRWLLKQKQTQDWTTPIATADAVYALLTTGENGLSKAAGVTITLGDYVIQTPADEALGYVKQQVSGDVLKIKEVTVDKASAGLGWGAVYAEFQEEMDKVIAQGNGLKVQRSMYKGGKKLPENASVEVGDRLAIHLTVTADRDMDFIRIKDERAACMEPIDVISGYRWNQRIGYYQETKDASTAFYIDKMQKGTYELSYEVYITSLGEYLQGVATVESVYAPEFRGHGDSGKVSVY